MQMESITLQEARQILSRDLIQEERKVYDSVYDFITFPKLVWNFIDMHHFQRLRGIKQLGCLSYVFPGAMHSRFEHSLGAGYLAQKYISIILKKMRKMKQIYEREKAGRENPFAEYEKEHKIKVNGQEINLMSTEDQAIFTVTLAGVLHDIGHGPFSHLFDSKVIKNVKQKKWTHELAGLYIIEALFQEVIKNRKSNQYEKAWLLQRVKPRVQVLILGHEEEGCEDYNPLFRQQIKERHWEFQIVSNRITGIDVDKLDYFRRDAYYTGAKNIFIDHELLMNETLILWDEKTKLFRVAYPAKYSEKVYDVFFSRYKLYKTYYLNHKSNGVDAMIKQILNKAKKKLGLESICEKLVFDGKVEEYLRLTDGILERIETKYEDNREKFENDSQFAAKLENKQFIQAYKILQKLRNRQIYDFVVESHQSYNVQEFKKYKQENNGISKKDQLKNRVEKFLKDNTMFDIAISEIGFGITEKDPFSQLCFFEKSLKTKVIIQKQDPYFFSMLRPSKIVEISVRIYYKERVNSLSQQLKQQIENKIKEFAEEIQQKYKMVRGNEGTSFNRNIFNKANTQKAKKQTEQIMKNIESHFEEEESD